MTSGVSSNTYELVKLQFSPDSMILSSRIIKEYLEIENYNKVSAADSEEKINKILQNLVELQKVCIYKKLEALTLTVHQPGSGEV